MNMIILKYPYLMGTGAVLANAKQYKQVLINMNMKRIRMIKQWGGSSVIALEPADLKDFNLKVGDEVIIDDIVKCDAQDLVDSSNTVEDITSENARENLSDIITKQRNDENGLPV